MQVTEAPVSTRPWTGMSSSVSWPVMGGPTAHPTGVTLVLDDPASSWTGMLWVIWEPSLVGADSENCP